MRTIPKGSAYFAADVRGKKAIIPAISGKPPGNCYCLALSRCGHTGQYPGLSVLSLLSRLIPVRAPDLQRILKPHEQLLFYRKFTRLQTVKSGMLSTKQPVFLSAVSPSLKPCQQFQAVCPAVVELTVINLFRPLTDMTEGAFQIILNSVCM